MPPRSLLTKAPSLLPLPRPLSPSLLLALALVVFSCRVTCVNCVSGDTVITSVGYVFETFSPYSALRFFEFNDKGWQLSENCLRDLYNYLEALRRGTLWAVKLYDAGGYYAGGAFADASNVRIHNPDLCRQLRLQYKEQLQLGSWSFLANHTVVPFAVHIVMAHYLLEIAAEGGFKPMKVQQLVCFPSTCDHVDLQQILDVYLFQSNRVVKNSTYIKHRVLKDVYNIRNDMDLYILIGFLCTSIFMYAIFSILRIYKSLLSYADEKTEKFDHHKHFGITGDFQSTLILNVKQLMVVKENESKGNGDVKNATPKEKIIKNDKSPKAITKTNSHYLNDILNAVSLHNVLYNLFGVDAAPQAAHYVIFTVLLTYEHLSTAIQFMASNLTPNKNIRMQPVTARELQHASFLIDIYFFVQGSKMATEFVRTFPRKKLRVRIQLTHVLKLTLQKALSFLPSYIFCVFLEHLLVTYFYHNIALEIPTYDNRNCQNHKLANVLYLDTFFPLSQRCMPWTWFISLEMQFFIIACLILLLAKIYPLYAIIISVATFVISLLAATLWELNVSPDPEYLLTLDYELTVFHLVFDNICLRIQLYILGICLGYMLERTNACIKLNIVVLICGWSAFILIFTLFAYGYLSGYDFLWPEITDWCRALLTTCAHSLFGLMLFWASLYTATRSSNWFSDLLTFKYLNAFERVSSVCLLIAPILIKVLIFTADGPIYTCWGQIFCMFVGCTFVSYVCAFTLHILFDGPLCAVMRETIMRNIDT